MNHVSFGGWDDCVLLESDRLKAIAPTAVGPRILYFGPKEGPNLLAVYDRHAGKSGGSEYRSYGGHRLWTAPEVVERTCEPDNDRLTIKENAHSIDLIGHAGPSGLRRSIEVGFVPGSDCFRLVHRVLNQSNQDWQIAPWAITVMALGGECLFLQEPALDHGSNLLPVRSMALWGYTDMSDPRWTWGKSVVRLRQTPDPKPQKCGAFLSMGMAAYLMGDLAFIKRFPSDPGTYPDFGSNFETFTRHDMLEVESLGQLITLEPGQTVEHVEEWHIVKLEEPIDNDESAQNWLRRMENLTSGKE